MMRARPSTILCLGAAAWMAAAVCHAALPRTSPPPTMVADPDLGRSDYIEHCAGCHGVEGSTAPARLPELRGRVGWFMCTPATRAYLLRLPNVAQSRIRDDAELANMMNHVVFVLGENSAPPGTRPFTAEEVARERRHPLTTAALTVERARHAEAAIRKCHAPAALRLLFGATPPR